MGEKAMKGKAITKVLSCFVVFAILMSTFSVAVIATNSANSTASNVNLNLNDKANSSEESVVLSNNITCLTCRDDLIQINKTETVVNESGNSDLPDASNNTYAKLESEYANTSSPDLINESDEVPDPDLPVINDTDIDTAKTVSSTSSCSYVWIKITDKYCKGYKVYVDGVYQFTEGGAGGVLDGYCCFKVTPGYHTFKLTLDGKEVSKGWSCQCGHVYNWMSMNDLNPHWCEDGGGNCDNPPTVSFDKSTYYEGDTVHATVSTIHSSVHYEIKDCSGMIRESGYVSNGETISYTIPSGASECCYWEICFYWNEWDYPDLINALDIIIPECSRCYTFNVCPKTTCEVYVKIDDDTCVGYEVYVDGVYQFTEGQSGTPDGYCAFYVTAGTHKFELRKNGYSTSKSWYCQCGTVYRWVSMPDYWCGSCKVYVIIDDDTCVGYEVYVDGVYKLTEGEGGTPDGYCAFYVTEGTHKFELRKNGCSVSKSWYCQCGTTYRWVSMNDMDPHWCNKPQEVKFKGTVIDIPSEGFSGGYWWNVKVDKWISGSLPCNTVHAYYVFYADAILGHYDRVQKGDEVEVYGSVDPNEKCYINLNGESYYINKTSSNNPPTLTEGKVNGETLYSCDTSTQLIFTVKYSDPDNEEPEYVKLKIGDTFYNMVKADPSDNDYTDGCIYTYSTKLPRGKYFFTFSTSDGNYHVSIEPNLSCPFRDRVYIEAYFVILRDVGLRGENFTGEELVDIINYYQCNYSCADCAHIQDILDRALRYVPEENKILGEDEVFLEYPCCNITTNSNNPPTLTEGKVNGETLYSCDTSTQLIFTVKYSDPDNDDPEYVKLKTGDSFYNMVKADPSDNDYTDGCIYTYSTKLPRGKYFFTFSTSDGNYHVSIEPNLSCPFRDRVYLEAYWVVYSDVVLKRGNFSDDELLDVVNYYLCNYSCADCAHIQDILDRALQYVPEENKTLGADEIFLEYPCCNITTNSNNPPTLTEGKVNGETLYSCDTSTQLIFTVKYSDPDNDEPEYVKLKIGDSFYNMVKADPSDNDYTDGCIYTYSTKLPRGKYFFTFSTSDGNYLVSIEPNLSCPFRDRVYIEAYFVVSRDYLTGGGDFTGDDVEDTINYYLCNYSCADCAHIQDILDRALQYVSEENKTLGADEVFLEYPCCNITTVSGTQKEIKFTGEVIEPDNKLFNDQFDCKVKIDKILEKSGDININEGDEVLVTEWWACGFTEPGAKLEPEIWNIKNGEKVGVYGKLSEGYFTSTGHSDSSFLVDLCGSDSYYFKKIGASIYPIYDYLNIDLIHGEIGFVDIKLYVGPNINSVYIKELDDYFQPDEQGNITLNHLHIYNILANGYNTITLDVNGEEKKIDLLFSIDHLTDDEKKVFLEEHKDITGFYQFDNWEGEYVIHNDGDILKGIPPSELIINWKAEGQEIANFYSGIDEMLRILQFSYLLSFDSDVKDYIKGEIARGDGKLTDDCEIYNEIRKVMETMAVPVFSKENPDKCVVEIPDVKVTETYRIFGVDTITNTDDYLVDETISLWITVDNTDSLYDPGGVILHIQTNVYDLNTASGLIKMALEAEEISVDLMLDVISVAILLATIEAGGSGGAVADTILDIAGSLNELIGLLAKYGISIISVFWDYSVDLSIPIIQEIDPEPISNDKDLEALTDDLFHDIDNVYFPLVHIDDAKGIIKTHKDILESNPVAQPIVNQLNIIYSLSETDLNDHTISLHFDSLVNPIEYDRVITDIYQNVNFDASYNLEFEYDIGGITGTIEDGGTWNLINERLYYPESYLLKVEGFSVSDYIGKMKGCADVVVQFMIDLAAKIAANIIKFIDIIPATDTVAKKITESIVKKLLANFASEIVEWVAGFVFTTSYNAILSLFDNAVRELIPSETINADFYMLTAPETQIIGQPPIYIVPAPSNLFKIDYNIPISFEETESFTLIGQELASFTIQFSSDFKLNMEEGGTLDDSNLLLIFARELLELSNSGSLTVTADGPVDIAVRNPDGLIFSKDSGLFSGCLYKEKDLDEDGEIEDELIIKGGKYGLYEISIIPETEANPNEFFSLSVSSKGDTITLAENVRISEIPDEPYSIELTDTGVIYKELEEKIARKYMPKIHQLECDIDDPKDNGLIKVGYSVEESKDEAKIEYNLVFNDEDDPNLDIQYDGIRKLLYGRIEDIEGFSITVDLNNDKIKEIEFDGTWHNDWEYYDPEIIFHNLPIDIFGDTRTFTDTSDFTVSNGHLDLYIGTWNHFFSNTADIQGIPCNEWVIVADYCLSDEKFVNKDRKELEDEYKG